MKSTLFLGVLLAASLDAFSQKIEIERRPVGETSIDQSRQTVKLDKLRSVKSSKIPVDKAKATLIDAFITVTTGDPGLHFVDIHDDKDRDTHWSCGTFDQKGRPVSSFHDDSDNDQYITGSKNVLKMHLDNAAAFADFQDNGQLHINIAPNGNDTWKIGEFVLTLDFDNPKVTQKITWTDILLNQDTRNTDLYFYFNGNNFVPRQ